MINQVQSTANGSGPVVLRARFRCDHIPHGVLHRGGASNGDLCGVGLSPPTTRKRKCSPEEMIRIEMELRSGNLGSRAHDMLAESMPGIRHRGVLTGFCDLVHQQLEPSGALL